VAREGQLGFELDRLIGRSRGQGGHGNGSDDGGVLALKKGRDSGSPWQEVSVVLQHHRQSDVPRGLEPGFGGSNRDGKFHSLWPQYSVPI